MRSTTRANPALEAALEPAALVGHELHRVLPADVHASVAAHARAVLEGETRHFESRPLL